jgi:hypothetical protein
MKIFLLKKIKKLNKLYYQKFENTILWNFEDLNDIAEISIIILSTIRENGPFYSVNDLMKVLYKKIGVMDKIRSENKKNSLTH